MFIDDYKVEHFSIVLSTGCVFSLLVKGILIFCSLSYQIDQTDQECKININTIKEITEDINNMKQNVSL